MEMFPFQLCKTGLRAELITSLAPLYRPELIGPHIRFRFQSLATTFQCCILVEEVTLHLFTFTLNLIGG